MHNTINITGDVFWVGGNDRRIALFENVYPVPNGVSYNSYLVLDEKTVLLDTVDHAVSKVFFENITHLLDGRSLDYIVVNHMEPDHAATLADAVRLYPDVVIVGNAKTFALIDNFFDIKYNKKVVAEGDTLNTGRHNFSFILAPMVHWIEVMVTYDSTDKVLFSADAFGTFGALSGNIFADEYPFKEEWLPEARRYYTNIVGKYGSQVTALLKKAAALDIAYVCPLHGQVWRKPADIAWFIDKYIKWSSYTPETNGVLIAYASVYGNTENAAEIVAAELAKNGVKDIAVYDVSKTHPSYLVAEAFKYSHFVFAATTYNAGVFVTMETLLADLKAHSLKNRTVALIENGSWAATSGSLMRKTFESMQNITVLENTLSIKSSLKSAQLADIQNLVASLAATLPKHEQTLPTVGVIEPTALFKISYGLFVLTANDGKTAGCGCITNVGVMITDDPKRVLIAVNKQNYTHDVIAKTGVFNINVLSVDATFDVVKRFGFQSARDVDKFKDFNSYKVAANGVPYLTEFCNAFISGKVEQTHDYGTHTLFVANVTETANLSDVKSATYQYYQDNIKPKPVTVEKKSGVKKYVCKICGYVHEVPDGEELPADIICPLCKHGKEAFELEV
jgi:flavorubredoxin/flavin reductase (DIM6/NTAB) family NADH-FMN oxidoreductase RutF/rubredoxin